MAAQRRPFMPFMPTSNAADNELGGAPGGGGGGGLSYGAEVEPVDATYSASAEEEEESADNSSPSSQPAASPTRRKLAAIKAYRSLSPDGDPANMPDCPASPDMFW